MSMIKQMTASLERVGWSIKAQLVAAAAILLLPSCILIIVSAYARHTDEIKAENLAVQHLAEDIAIDTAEFLNGTRQILEKMAQRPLIKALDPSRCDPIIRDLNSWHQSYTNLSVIDRTGQVICTAHSLPDQKLPNLKNRDWLEKAANSKTFLIGDPVIGVTTNLWIAPLVLPLLDHNDIVVGFLAATVDLAEFKPHFPRRYFSVGTELSIIDSIQRRIGSSEASGSNEWIGRQFTLPNGQKPLDRIQSDKNWAGRDRGADQNLYSFAISLVPGSHWYVVAVAPTEALSSASRRILISSVLVIVAIMAGAGILATLILRQIEKPIRSIEATAGAHIRGDTTARATEAGPKEFISVATQFNRMLDARDQAIADLKISDSSLREKNDIISTMIDNMTQGLVMFDAATRIVVCNRRYLQMYRLSPDVVKPGLTLLELIKHRSETGSFNGDPHELCRQMRKVIAKGRTAQVVETNHGHMIQLLIQPMADGGWVATHEDVTDKRQAELERDRAKTFLNLIIENTPSPIFVKDADSGRYILVNRAFEEFCGISRAEMIGKTARHIFANEEANLITSREEIFLQTHQVISDELTICTPRNGLRSVTSKRLAVRGSDGATQFVIGVIEDHTDRKNIEAQLRQAQKMEAIGNLTGGVAHDFNNLLTVMIGNLDMLLEENAGKPQMTQTVDTILEAALRGAELIKQMLAFSRLQPLQPKDVDVNALADKTMKLLTRTLGEAIRIDLRKSLDECRILVDAAQLEAALVNIAINARDAMPTGGILAVATEKVFFTPENAARRPGLAAGEHIIVKIADTGTGMSSEVMSHIFEPFYTTKETGEGTGLGLSMVYGFVKQSGGYISVTSSPGAGTTFELCFPAAAATAAAGVSAANHAGGRLPAASEVVLVVDDQASVRATAVANLKSLGYQVYEADCGKAALAMLTTGVRIDLLFTDIVMPGITGLELAKISCAERPGLKVLYTSGYSGALHDDRSEGSINGALLVKPYRKRELAKAVADVLAAA